MPKDKIELLATLLNRQIDDLDPSVLHALEERFAAAIAAGITPSEEDIGLIWKSPSARIIYTRARKRVLVELENSWRRRGYPTELVQWAASSRDSSREIGNGGVTLRMVRSPMHGDWLITVELAAEARMTIPNGVVLRISDSGGLIWLEGEIDPHGGLDAFWNETQPPMERLRSHKLIIEFV